MDELARRAGLNVPEAQLLNVSSGHRTFACRRFDRLPSRGRRFFVSAMALLARRDGESASYLELAEFISRCGSVDGWRLAPAYDLNANVDKAEHVLAIDAIDPSPDVNLALATAEYYGLDGPQAAEILDRVQRSVGQWRPLATGLRLPREEMDRMAQAFPSTAEQSP